VENTKVKNQNLNYVRPAYLVKTSKKALFGFRIMTLCICQKCGEKKEIESWSPKNAETTFRIFGIKGSHLPICIDCFVRYA